MDKKMKVALGVLAGIGVAAAVVYLGVSYVTSAGDQTRPGVRVARRLGVKPSV
jgi:hypothetical protein